MTHIAKTHHFIRALVISSVLILTCGSFSLVFADHQVGHVGGGNVNTGGGNVNPGAPGQLTNPLQSQTITEFLLKIIDVLLVFALPLIVLYIMYAGYLFVTANGNSEQVGTARNALLWAVVGGVLVLGARLVIAVIQGTVDAF